MADDSTTNPVQLGRELADARAERNESLKSVGTAAGISAAYLQKLERGMVESPSPRILRSLASYLAVPYARLMNLAGYDVPRHANIVNGRLERALADARLSQTEERAVAAFVEHLLGQRQTHRRRS